MGVIEVVGADLSPVGLGGGVVDQHGRTKTERDIAEGLEQLRRKVDAPVDPNARRLVGTDGEVLETELSDRKALVDFQWTRDVPTDWQERLDHIFPPNDRISWLKLVWVAGDELVSRAGRVTTDPVQRWVVFQMSRQIPAAVRPFLEGPPPHPKHNRIPLMREQWDLYKSDGCYGQPYWIIQGEKGGHKRRFTKHEQKILKAERRPIDPPAAGELPYAPFDQRVLDKLIAFDHVQFWNRAIEFEERGADQLDAEEKQAAEACRGWLLDWLDSQVEAAIDSIPIGPIQTSRDVAPLDVDLERHKLITASY
jgi:hypothetical protein